MDFPLSGGGLSCRAQEDVLGIRYLTDCQQYGIKNGIVATSFCQSIHKVLFMNNLGRSRENILTRESGHSLLNDLYDDFGLSIKSGLNNFGKLPPEIRADMRNRTLAGTLNDLIVQDAIRRFDKAVGISLDEDCDGALFIVQGKAALRFKKVGKPLIPKNALTERREDSIPAVRIR